MTREERIKERLKSDYDFLVENGYNVVGVFLYGSDNYAMNTPTSDIDVKAIVLPHFDDIVDSKDWVSKEYHREEDGGKLEVKDIRLMFDSYKKQNINFLETMFTKYKYINRDYIAVWEGMIEKNRESIARYNPLKSILFMYGNMKTKYKSMLHEAPHNEEEIKKYGYSLKDFHHIARLYDFIGRYIDGEESYAQILIPKHKDLLIRYKTEALSLEDVKLLSEEMIESTRVKVDEKVSEWRDNPPNKDVEKLLREVQRMLIKQALEEELLKDKTMGIESFMESMQWKKKQ